MTPADVAARLHMLIAEALEASGRDPLPALSDDDFLPAALDSVVLSALLVMIEDEWGFEVADDEIEPQIFETIKTLTRFVEDKVQK